MSDSVQASHSDACFDAVRPKLSPHTAHVFVEQSPLHAYTYHRLLGGQPRPATDAMAQGTLLHNLLLELGDRVIELDFDAYRSNAAKEARDAALADGKLPALSEKLGEARRVVKGWRERLAEIRLPNGRAFDFADGETEMALEWSEGEILAHGRVDWISLDRSLIADFKATEGHVDPDTCGRAILNSAAVIQDHAYRRAIELGDLERAGRVDMLFFYGEIQPPYFVTPVYCDAGLREIGSSKWRRACKGWAQCLRTHRWPGYTTHPVAVSAPEWALRREMNQELLG